MWSGAKAKIRIVVQITAPGNYTITGNMRDLTPFLYDSPANNTASIYSSADPLWCGHRITPAHALCVFEYDGDIKAMLAGLTSGQLYLFSSYAADAAPALQALSK